MSDVIKLDDIQETVATVGNSASEVLAKDDFRQYIQLINDSDTVKGDAELNSGTRLNANGGNIVFDRIIPKGSISAICSSTDKKLLITTGKDSV